MLYSEFLNGTYEPDNKWTYKEYQRIEAIYNEHEEMTKEEAYKLFREPDDFTRMLLDEIAELKESKATWHARAEKLQKDVDKLQSKLKEATINYEQLQANVYNEALRICNLTKA